MSIFDTYKTGKSIIKDFDKLWNDVLHSGKDYLGEILVQDSAGCLWKIKVRNTGNRGRYLKIKSKSNESRKIRATADNYKDYAKITPEEWEAFYLLANGQSDSDLYNEAKKVLDRLF